MKNISDKIFKLQRPVIRLSLIKTPIFIIDMRPMHQIIIKLKNIHQGIFYRSLQC